MDILLYLSELLQQHKEVGITGLGTFYKKKFPGRYDKEKQSFLPPGYTLEFSPEVKEENILPEFITEKRNISAESANYYVAQFVEDTNKKLELEHEAVLENIGRLFFTEHEGLSFEPAKDINYGSEFYGLPTLSESETIAPEPTQTTNEEEEVYEEIAEAPAATPPLEKQEQVLPVIENIELDEVRDDLKNTLKHTEHPVEVPESVKEQHQEHPNQFGHQPESEQAHQEKEVPEFIKEQHEEHPNRFGHQPESEVPKTYINLHDEVKEEPVIEAPEFIKEQHAEHPNRFGHDPIADYPQSEESNGMSLWLKIAIAVLAVIILVAIAYLVKPELFQGNQPVEAPQTAVADSSIVPVDSAKIKQDSIAKTDSILKANQVQKQAAVDTVKKPVVTKPAPVQQKEEKAIENTKNSTFDVIAASFQSEKKANEFIRQMKKYGIEAKIAKLPGRMKKISIASFPTEQEARKQRPELAKKINIKELDIIQINNNTP
ncbi:SPOR domain-containing protein [Pedobacter sp.]|uniref:HU domain-containing protein n=1 Tax=Pedobacter sp. TaxID=1411316 RepID=UPI003BAD2928